MSAAVALQAALSGLAAGVAYGLVGAGFALVRRATGVLNLAHGELVSAPLLLAVLLTVGTTPVLVTPGPATAVLQVLMVLVAGPLLGWLLYVGVVRGALRRDDPRLWAAGTLSAGLLLRAMGGLAFPRESVAIADPLRLGAWAADGVVRLPGDQVLPARTLAVLVLGIAVAVALDVALRRSRAGRAVRAVADDPEGATLVGINPERAAALAFLVAGLVAAVAGLLVLPGTRVGPTTGTLLGLKGAAAAAVGGLRGPRSALVAGLALGVIESLAVAADWPGPPAATLLALVVLLVALFRTRSEA